MNQVDKNGETPLIIACCLGYTEVPSFSYFHFSKSFAHPDCICVAGVPGCWDQHQDSRGLDCPGGGCRQGAPWPGQSSPQASRNWRQHQRQSEWVNKRIPRDVGRLLTDSSQPKYFEKRFGIKVLISQTISQTVCCWSWSVVTVTHTHHHLSGEKKNILTFIPIITSLDDGS